MKQYKIFIIAGEASGDMIGGKLMHELKSLIIPEFYGIGGERMQAEGLSSIFPIADISVMGFVEILPQIWKIRNRINLLANEIKKIKPDIVITIDSPDFCFRVVKKIKHLNIKLVHYVAPTVWAYREKRAEKVANLYDHLITLLPFEPEYFQIEGLDTTFVGHPILEEEIIKNKDFRQKHRIEKSDFILSIAPGSRKSEVERLMPIFIEAANKFTVNYPNTIVSIPSFENLKPYIKKNLPSIRAKRVITSYDPQGRKEILSASDLAITKCGTITNEFALYKIPMVAAYKINQITAFFLKRIVKLKYFSLINILAAEEVIPELIQENCTSEKIFMVLESLFKSEKLRLEQVEKSTKVLLLLRNQSRIKPSKKAAKLIFSLLKKI